MGVAEIAKNSLKDLFKKLLTDQVSKQITKDCGKIFPLENVLVRKLKVLKKPKFDLTKLMELYQDKPEVAKATDEARTPSHEQLAPLRSVPPRSDPQLDFERVASCLKESCRLLPNTL